MIVEPAVTRTLDRLTPISDVTSPSLEFLRSVWLDTVVTPISSLAVERNIQENFPEFAPEFARSVRELGYGPLEAWNDDEGTVYKELDAVAWVPITAVHSWQTGHVNLDVTVDWSGLVHFVTAADPGDPEDNELGYTSIETDAEGRFYHKITLKETLGFSEPGWDTREAFIDVLAHEIGHVITNILLLRYGQPYVEERLREIFDAPSAPWNTGPWENRVLEAAAEFFKDWYLLDAARHAPNRTNHDMADFAAWKELYVEDLVAPFEVSADDVYDAHLGGLEPGEGTNSDAIPYRTARDKMYPATGPTTPYEYASDGVFPDDVELANVGGSYPPPGFINYRAIADTRPPNLHASESVSIESESWEIKFAVEADDWTTLDPFLARPTRPEIPPIPAKLIAVHYDEEPQVQLNLGDGRYTFDFNLTDPDSTPLADWETLWEGEMAVSTPAAPGPSGGGNVTVRRTDASDAIELDFDATHPYTAFLLLSPVGLYNSNWIVSNFGRTWQEVYTLPWRDTVGSEPLGKTQLAYAALASVPSLAEPGLPNYVVTTIPGTLVVGGEDSGAMPTLHRVTGA